MAPHLIPFAHAGKRNLSCQSFFGYVRRNSSESAMWCDVSPNAGSRNRLLLSDESYIHKEETKKAKCRKGPYQIAEP